MKSVRLTGAFGRDLKRLMRRRYNLNLIEAIIDALRSGEPLPASAKPHPLKGEWKNYMDCHVQPDWILIYQVRTDEVVLARTGTHTDLFGT